MYEVLLINGGYGAVINATTATLYAKGGGSGYRLTFLAYLEKGQVIPITIGAGGLGQVDSVTPNGGGVTIFNGISTNDRWADRFADSGSMCQTSRSTAWVTTGMGGFSYAYGCGGYASAANNYTNKSATDGAQGCVRLRFHNPDKV